MISKLLSGTLTAMAPGLGNHLWQSTLFAFAAGLLTLALRKNRAQVRYGLWVAASVKFLIPFSLLVGVGSHLAWSRGSVSPQASLYFAMEQVGQPFAQRTLPLVSRGAASVAFQGMSYIPAIVLILWLCGFLAALLVWCVRWRQISGSVRRAAPLREGRELDALRRLERVQTTRHSIELLSSQATLEPGILGIARPVLVWPEGISERLDDAQLEAVLAHELCHVRRRDNLVAATHMLVEAIFWFHPLVWWMGRRLVDERERACDEEVLEFGSDRHVYAESILKICEFCVGSPMPCVSAITGADLKKRIARIMSQRAARKLDVRRRLLLGAAATLAVAAPIAAGMFHIELAERPAHGPAQNTTAALPTYSSVSIRPSQFGGDNAILMFGPDEFVSKNASLLQVIRTAYGMEDDRIFGAPDWLGSEKYDLEAKENRSGAEGSGKLDLNQSGSQQRRMLQALLANRLELAVHRETREIGVYALVIAKDGSRLREAKPREIYIKGPKGPDSVSGPGIWMSGSELQGRGVGVGPLVFHLSRQLHQTVLDGTGLPDDYDFTLRLPDGIRLGIDNPASPESSEPAISSALEQQLGLKLEPRKTSMEVIVIDHVEKPAKN